MTRKKSAIRPAIGAERLDEWNDPRHMTPFLPTEDPGWQELCIEVAMESARLQEAVHPNLRAALSPLLELMNCYYSNLIEGHRTFPGEVARALNSAQDQKKQEDLVVEALAHVKTQGEMAHRLRDPGWNPTSPESLRWMHRDFMERLPGRMLWLEYPGHKRLKIVPGELRGGKVSVGSHDPPLFSALPVFLEEFHKQYADHDRATPHAFAMIAAAHHRLAWIHPFYDGNGRVARLMTDAMLERAGVGAGGLWRISRGFARRVGEYRRFLENADATRRSSLDGRGNLTQRGLDEWCGFVIACAKDQIRFMRDSIRPAALADRIRAWARDSFPHSDHERIGLLISQVMKDGEVSRSHASILLGVGERQARNIVDDLVERSVVAAEPRGPIRPAISLKVVPRWFPDLFPHSEDELLAKP
jgi:Fic family protein